ncbi:MAG TPA: MFS transporter [Candidatus Binatia bacterium]|nr:MFS transporter [Candidatus Binatia bacterium]
MRFRLSADGWLIFAACAVRSFAYGFISIILGLYLDAVGLSTTEIGWIFTAALAGGAVMTIVIASVADRVGRKNMLVLGAGLMALAGWIFVVSGSPILLALAAVFGTISPSGKDVGPFLSLEQAILPQSTSDQQRTAVFSAYNLVGSFASALGALAVSLPQSFVTLALSRFRFLVWSYVVCAFLMMALFLFLSRSIEANRKTTWRESKIGLHQSGGKVTKLAALFALDAFAGGFIVQGIVAYWFHLRYAADLNQLSGIFFGINILSAVSFLAAPAIARRIGLLNTMVFTHLPSNFLILLVPFMPSLELTVIVLLLRNLLSQLDVPTRQSYTMAIVEPDERASVAGLLSVSRNTGAALAPLFTGAILANPVYGWPFLLAGGLKVIYDLLIFALFRNVKPPEEAN